MRALIVTVRLGLTDASQPLPGRLSERILHITGIMNDQTDKKRQQDNSEAEHAPSDAQLDAAIQGLQPGEGNSFGIRGDRANQPFGGGAGRSGSGNPMGGGGLGIDTSGAGPGEQPDNPAAETGGPRGAGTSISSTSGGRTAGGAEPRRDPGELIRESTSRPVDERRRAEGSAEAGDTRPDAAPDDSLVRKGGIGSDADASDVSRDSYGFTGSRNIEGGPSAEEARDRLDEIVPTPDQDESDR